MAHASSAAVTIRASPSGLRDSTVAVGGVLATHDTIVAKRYAVVRPFLFLSREEPTGAARVFIDYVLGPEGQRLLGLEGLIPAVAP